MNDRVRESLLSGRELLSGRALFPACILLRLRSPLVAFRVVKVPDFLRGTRAPHEESPVYLLRQRAVCRGSSKPAVPRRRAAANFGLRRNRRNMPSRAIVPRPARSRWIHHYRVIAHTSRRAIDHGVLYTL